MNGNELRFGRIENRLNFCLLIRRQVQLLGDSLKAKFVAMPTPTSTRLRLYDRGRNEGLRGSQRAERKLRHLRLRQRALLRRRTLP